MSEKPNPDNYDPDASISEMLGEVVTNARCYAEAEVRLAKAKAVSSAMPYKNAAIYFVAAGIIGLAALGAFLVMMGIALATLIGPLAAGIVLLVVAAGIAGLLAQMGKKKLEAR